MKTTMNTLSTQQLKTMIDNGEDVLIVNTLDEKDFDATNIPNSINIPQSEDDFVRQVERISNNPNRRVVVYCASEACDSSTKAAKKLDDAGFSEVYVYTGGAKAWKDAGEKLFGDTTLQGVCHGERSAMNAGDESGNCSPS